MAPRSGLSLEFIVDLTRLERVLHQVYDGQGIEGEEPLDLDAEGVTAADLGLDAVFSPAPCLQLLASPFPVGSYLTSVRRGERHAPPARAPTFLVLNRRAFVVTIAELDREQHAALAALAGGPPSARRSGRSPTTGLALADRVGGAGFFRSLRRGSIHAARRRR